MLMLHSALCIALSILQQENLILSGKEQGLPGVGRI